MAVDRSSRSEPDQPPEPDLIDRVDEVFPGAWNDQEHLPDRSDDDADEDPTSG